MLQHNESHGAHGLQGVPQGLQNCVLHGLQLFEQESSQHDTPNSISPPIPKYGIQSSRSSHV